MGARFRQVLQDEKIFVTLYKNRIRISVSVYNDMDDIDRLVKILAG
jgi:selenocysteine lyase/cysteine desulfurase